MSRKAPYVVIGVTILLGLLFSQPGQCQLCTGDVNGNGIPLEHADLTYLIDYVYSGGPPPIPLYQGDLNGDYTIDQGDIDRFQCYFDHGFSCFPIYPVPTCYPGCLNTNIGACCEELGKCFRRSFHNCLNANGRFLGEGTSCTPLPQDCDMNCVHPPAGLVAWYPFDETSGTVAWDIAGKHNAVHSPPVGSPEYDRFGSVTFGSGKVRNRYGIVWGARGIVRTYDDPFKDIGSSDFTIDAWILATGTNVPCPNPFKFNCFSRPIICNMDLT